MVLLFVVLQLIFFFFIYIIKQLSGAFVVNDRDHISHEVELLILMSVLYTSLEKSLH